MAKRKKRRQRHIGLWLLLLVLLVGLIVGLRATKIYMAHTGEDFFPALWNTIRLGGTFTANYLSVSEDAIPVNPYHSEDYYYRGDLLHCATSEASYAGVDVSSHQEEIDWEAVAGAGIDFAIVRVGYRGYTEGEIFPDSYALQNIEGALAAGLKVGVYFFSQAISEKEAREEAKYVLDIIEDYDITYPVLFDWEGIFTEARTDHVTGEEMTRFAIAFCEEIEKAGYTAGVYFNQSYGYNYYHLRSLHDYEFWLAEYQQAQSFAYEVQLWQYDCEARIPGIKTTVDLNLCYRSYPSDAE